MQRGLILIVFSVLSVLWQQALGIDPGLYLPGRPVGTSDARVYGLSVDGSTAVGVGTGSNQYIGYHWSQSTGRTDFSGSGYPVISNALSISGNGNVTVGAAGASINGTLNAYRKVGDAPLELIPNIERYTRGRANAASYDGSVVVGRTDRAVQSPADGQAYRWTAQTGTQPLGFLGTNGTFSDAIAVSADGNTIVGRSQSGGAFGPSAAFIWRPETGMQALPLGTPADGRESTANAISANGRFIAGQTTTSVSENSPRLCMWRDGAFSIVLEPPPIYLNVQALGVSGDGNLIVGTLSGGAPGVAAFVWSQSTGMITAVDYLTRAGMVLPAGASIPYVYCISDNGFAIGGGIQFPGEQIQPFIAVIPAPSVGIGLAAAVLTLRRRQRQ